MGGGETASKFRRCVKRARCRSGARLGGAGASGFTSFFCGELDSSASGRHDGFIRGLQPLSCFSL